MRARALGLSLVELLVALAIGSILIVGATFVYQQSRSTFTTSDAVARLQENARYALSIIEPDVQLAGYYGFSNSPDDLKFMWGGTTAAVVPSMQMQTSSPRVAALDAAFHTCGDNFAIDVLATVEGVNDAYTLACAAQGGGARALTDALTIRRASTEALGAATNGTLQMLVSRLSPSNQYVLADGALPASPAVAPEMVEVRDLVVRTYYISNDSDPAVIGVPALRVKALGPGGFTDEEIMSGIEDLQVQFGIDTGDYDGDGIIDIGLDGNADGIPDAPNGIATRYVNPDALPAGFQVVSVRVWLLVRAPQPEQGFVDGLAYAYAGKNFTPNDAFRRVLVSRTIQLRNARTL
jgi:type IV pilus assembly protein PilW